jgi:GTPase
VQGFFFAQLKEVALSMKFIDEVNIEVIAGHGGPGCISFKREKFMPRGGPDGGNGGRGGDIVFVAQGQSSTLQDFRYKNIVKAKPGEGGRGSCCDGRKSEALIVPVPVGTVVYDESDEVLADFTKPDQEHVIAKGGRGGKGNAFFVSSTRQAPKFAQPGEEGDHKKIRLELKLLADVGLVGLPNAGKSTLLSVVTHAKPKIAGYPFTTLKPILGVVAYKEDISFVIADLPGLIEGAHEGKGMGDKFLKHAERTRVLIHCISLSPDEMEEPKARFELIENELKQYGHDLASKPRIVLLTKIDLISADEVSEWQKEFAEITTMPCLTVSSVTRRNLDDLLHEIVKHFT